MHAYCMKILPESLMIGRVNVVIMHQYVHRPSTREVFLSREANQTGKFRRENIELLVCGRSSGE